MTTCTQAGMNFTSLARAPQNLMIHVILHDLSECSKRSSCASMEARKYEHLRQGVHMINVINLISDLEIV